MSPNVPNPPSVPSVPSVPDVPKAQVAFLQGERQGQESLKLDLVRRIRMLEFALKQERCKLQKLKLGPGEKRPEEPLSNGPVELEGAWRDGRRLLRHHFDAVRALAFVPCHPALVTASEDATLKLWDLQKPLGPKKSAALDVEPVYAFRGHSAGVDARIRCWRLPGLDSDPYDGYGGRAQVNQVLAHPWQPLTITASDDGAIRYLDNRTGSVVHSVVAHLDAVTCLALDSSGSVLMSGSE
ncbi:Striatin-4 [Lonchura striata]|uniref:Striatin-4 n=1 Tax=Lonchura striata TaxID=40157 RepID=A0A218U8J8_9PASE|nr:Striatin-4 [Lonchura striata domestica]